jgi:phosphoesterase RecJ-like protein
LDRGCDFERIVHFLYNNYREARFRIQSYLLGEGMQVFPEHRTVLLVLPKRIKDEFGYRDGESEGLVNMGLSLAGINLAVMMNEEADRIRMSFRSIGQFPANDFAKHFSGGGHHNAAGGRSYQPLEATISEFKQKLAEYSAQLQYDPFQGH